MAAIGKASERQRQGTRMTLVTRLLTVAEEGAHLALLEALGDAAALDAREVLTRDLVEELDQGLVHGRARHVGLRIKLDVLQVGPRLRHRGDRPRGGRRRAGGRRRRRRPQLQLETDAVDARVDGCVTGDAVVIELEVRLARLAFEVANLVRHRAQDAALARTILLLLLLLRRLVARALARAEGARPAAAAFVARAEPVPEAEAAHPEAAQARRAAARGDRCIDERQGVGRDLVRNMDGREGRRVRRRRREGRRRRQRPPGRRRVGALLLLLTG
jgi:hypothetical protein